jgi:hypothetical protein
MAAVIAPGGDVDVAAVAALFADRTRARVLIALSDGPALTRGCSARPPPPIAGGPAGRCSGSALTGASSVTTWPASSAPTC